MYIGQREHTIDGSLKLIRNQRYLDEIGGHGFVGTSILEDLA